MPYLRVVVVSSIWSLQCLFILTSLPSNIEACKWKKKKPLVTKKMLNQKHSRRFPRRPNPIASHTTQNTEVPTHDWLRRIIPAYSIPETTPRQMRRYAPKPKNRHRRFNKLYRAMVYQPPKSQNHTKEIYPCNNRSRQQGDDDDSK